MSEQIRKRSAAVTPRGVNHLVINVRDMEESHHFWCDLLGFKQVGELHHAENRPNMTMRFYSGVVDDVNHHDVALVEQKDLPEPPAEWSMYKSTLGDQPHRDHLSRSRVVARRGAFLKDNGVKMNLRVDHGMTHSVYINDPNGYGVEVLYDLPEEVWMHDIDGALNYGVQLPEDQLLVDDTNYTTDFTRRP